MARVLRDPFAYGPNASMPPELFTSTTTPAAPRRRQIDKTDVAPEEVADE